MSGILIINNVPYKVEPLSDKESSDVAALPKVKSYNVNDIDWTKKEFSDTGWASISVKTTKKEDKTLPDTAEFKIEYKNTYSDDLHNDQSLNEGEVKIHVTTGVDYVEAYYSVRYDGIPGYGHTQVDEKGSVMDDHYYSRSPKEYTDDVVEKAYSLFNSLIAKLDEKIILSSSTQVEKLVKNYLRPFYVENFLSPMSQFMEEVKFD